MSMNTWHYCADCVCESIHVYPHVATCQYVQYLWNSFLPYCMFVFMQTIDVVYL